MESMQWVGLSVLGYLCGSLPFGFWCSRWLGGTEDIRALGSKSTGTTNVLRVAGKAAAALTLILDIFKGFFPTFLALSLDCPEAPFVGICAVMGHIFPLFLHFKGGKGIATALGVFLALSGTTGGLLFLLWLGILTATRYVFLASLGTAFLAPFFVFFLGKQNLLPASLFLSALLVWTHRANLRRLREGKEPRIGEKTRVD